MREGARKLVTSVGWMTGGSAVAALAQVPYAAVTARILRPDDFGAYAAALVVMTGLALLANAGLNEAVARLGSPEPSQVRALATYAVVLGAVFGLTGWASAQGWASLFGLPDMAPVLRFLSVSVLMAPMLALVSGVARQAGRFRQYSMVTTSTALIGLAVGLSLVVTTGDVLALAAPGVVTPALTVAGHRLFTGRWILPGRPVPGLLAHLGFGGRATAINLIEYLGIAGTQATVSRGLGASALGQWNRAAVFSQMPLQLLSLPVSRVIYPQLGEDWDRSRRADLFDSATYLLTWSAVVMSAVWGALLTGLLPVLLGAGWETAAALSLPLSLGGGLVLASTAHTSALMAGGEHRRLLVVQVAASILLLASAVGGVLAGAIWIPAVAVPSAALLRFVLADRQCRRAGFANIGSGRSLLASLAVGTVITGAVLAAPFVGSALGFASPLLAQLLVTGICVMGVGALWVHAPRTQGALVDVGVLL